MNYSKSLLRYKPTPISAIHFSNTALFLHYCGRKILYLNHTDLVTIVLPIPIKKEHERNSHLRNPDIALTM